MEETTQAPAPSSKKWLWIGLGVVALLILGSMFTGAFGRGTGLGSAYFMPGVDVDQNMDGSVTYETEEGTVTMGGTSMPDNWPSDVPTAYTGATIIYAGNNNPTTGAAGSAVVYTTDASVQSVVEYYTARLKAEGWTVEGSGTMQNMTVLTATKDTRTFGAYVADNGQGQTSVTVGVEM